MMFATLMLLGTLVKPIPAQQVAATVSTCDGSTVAVEIKEADGNIEIYQFYGDGFVPNEEITLVMIGDKIVGIK